MKSKTFLFIIVLFVASFSHAQNRTEIVEISQKQSGEITLGDIIGKKLIPLNENVIVESFTLKIFNNSQAFMSYELNVSGDIVNKKTSNELRMLPAGTKIIFTKIKLKGSQGEDDFKYANDIEFILID